MLWILLSILILVIACGALLSRIALFGRRQTDAQAIAWAREHVPFLPDVGALESVSLSEDGGRPLKGWLLKCGHAPRGCVVITHGYTDTHIGALKYAPVYLDMGYDCLVYDLRGHGGNPRAACTYSVRESEDLYRIFRAVREAYPVVGLHGESLGAATTAAVMKYHPDAAFAVCDCGFCDILPILKKAMRSMRIPVCLVHLASLFSWLVSGVPFEAMRPLDALGPDTKVPMLFIHGEKDTFIPPVHSQRMRDALPRARVVLIPGAGHAASVLTDPEGYAAAVKAFIRDAEEGAV